MTSENRHAAEFVISEAGGNRSRENIFITPNPITIVAGTVLGKLDASADAQPDGGNTGGGVLTMDVTTPVLANAENGVYLVTCTTAAGGGGTFTVTDPNGAVLGTYVVGAAAFANGIKFTIADGTPDFAENDFFTVAVVAAQYAPTDLEAVDGSAVAKAVALYDVPGAGPGILRQVSAIVRKAEVNGNLLTYHSSVDEGAEITTKKTELAAVGIIVR